MQVVSNCSLLPYNTFGIDAKAKIFAQYSSVEELKELLTKYRGEKILHIGQGSNLLFTKDFDGVIGDWLLVIYMHDASLGILQSPRGESETQTTFGPSGIQLRLNCWVQKRRMNVLSHLSMVASSYWSSKA